MSIWVMLKGLKKNCLAKKSFIVREQVKRLATKGMIMPLSFGVNLKWKQWNYHDLYLKYHVLLLANVFLKNRNNNLKTYGLCPSHYLSAPALSWNGMLDMTKVELELIPDPDIYLFIEKGHVFVLWKRYERRSILHF